MVQYILLVSKNNFKKLKAVFPLFLYPARKQEIGHYWFTNNTEGNEQETVS